MYVGGCEFECGWVKVYVCGIYVVLLHISLISYALIRDLEDHCGPLVTSTDITVRLLDPAVALVPVN